MIRLLLVDDQPVVRAGAARILGPDDGFEVVAECDDGDQVVSAVAAHRLLGSKYGHQFFAPDLPRTTGG